MTLPQGWAEVTIDDVASVRADKTDPRSLGEVPFIGLEHIEPHTSRLLGQGVAGDVRSTVAQFKAGDILFGRLRPYLNKVTEAPFDGCASAEILPFTPHDGVTPKLLKRVMMSTGFLDFTASLDKGDRPRVAAKEVGAFKFLLPPEAEQRRIVTKLDALTAHLARARMELDRVPVLAARLRRVALTKAFSASLPSTDATNGTKRPLPALPSEFGAVLYPPSWKAAPLTEISANCDGRRIPIKASDRANRQGPYPYYGASGVIDSVDSYIFDGEYVLIAEDGANLLSRSTPIAFLASGTFWVNNHAHVLQARSATTNDWIRQFFNAIDLTPYVSGSAQPKLTQGNLNRISVPLPPLDEQQCILRVLAAIFAHADRLEKEAARTKTLLDLLESTILARAFRGELIPQDPADEPASALLDRIRASRASAPTAKRGRRGAAHSVAAGG